MNVGESVKFAWRGVTANKSRSALTMLGVMIGVAAVIILVAVGKGASQSVSDTLSSLGTNTLTITPGAGTSQLFGEGVSGGGTAKSDTGTSTRAATLTMGDADAIADPTLAPDVLRVAPVVNAMGVTATLGGASHTVGTTIGTTPAYLVINNDVVALGTAFSDADLASHSRVVLLGVEVARALVPGDGSDALGQVIRLNGKEFTVIGILEEKGSTGPSSGDNRIIAPATAVQDHLAGYGNLSSISAQATSSETVSGTRNRLLAGRLRYSANEPGRLTPTPTVAEQRCRSPARQFRQWPHTMCPSPVTRSPTS